MKCKRCGTATARLSLGQRYCVPCARDVERLTVKPKPLDGPEWLKQLTPSDMTGHMR